MSKNKKKLPPGVRERDGRFTYRYSVEVVVNGKRTRKQKETPAFPTAKEAYNAGILIEANRLTGKVIDEKNTTLKDWIERWLKDYEIEREPTIGTLRSRKIGLNSLKKYLGELTKIKDITADEYQQYLNNLKRDGRKRGTIQQYHASALMMFKDAVRKEVISNNPADGAIVPAFKTTLTQIEAGLTDIPKFLEKKQLRHFLQIVRFRGKPQEYNIFLTLAYTGLRIGELAALKVSDFNENDRTLSITKNLVVHGSVKNYRLGPPKNNSSIRKVSIGESVIKAIKSQLAWRDSKIQDGLVTEDHGFIFWSVHNPGYPCCFSNLTDRFKELLELAKLSKELTPHSLRHTHVSLLAEAGEQLAVIQERLGHKNDEITKKVYLHITEEQRKLVPDRFEQVMNS